MEAVQNPGSSFARWAEYVALALLALLIGGFSLFVGYFKALGPLDELARHSAWTIHLPVLLGRTLGWLEMLAAAVMIVSLAVPRLARAGWIAAIWITLNHSVAAIVHIGAKEWHTLTQSAVMITLCLILVTLAGRRAASVRRSS